MEVKMPTSEMIDISLLKPYEKAQSNADRQRFFLTLTFGKPTQKPQSLR